MGFIKKINDAVQKSYVGKFFEMEERKTNFFTELRGGTATFMSMAYILAVNPSILSASGGPCVANADDGGIFGPSYELCLEKIKREFVTGTAISAMFGCLLMGLWANLPIGVAPGLGVNAYFTYTVVGFRGTGGKVSYQTAVTAVAIEGAIFFLLSVSGVRYFLIKLVPEPVRIATPAAIGAFLAHIGLQTSEGIGAVAADIATVVGLGACPPEYRVPIVAYTDACKADSSRCITSDAFTCKVLGHQMASARTWVGIMGLMIMATLLAYRVRMAFIVGIAFVTFISWFRDTAITYFPNDPTGDARFEYFKKVATIQGVSTVITPYTSELSSVGLALFTFLYVDFLDTTGTLFGLASAMNIVDKDGKFPRMRAAFCADSLSIVFGSLFGLAPLTAFIESGAGVEAGARTGLAAVTIAFFFFLSIFFAPIVSNIPPWATGGALILVGSLMARALGKIQWHNTVHAITAFITVIVMPLTYSIAYGVIAGIGAFVIMEGVIQLLALAGVPRPVFEEPLIDETAMPMPGAKKDIVDDDDSEEVDVVEKPKADVEGDEEAH